jgi:glycosyltransferase involved in cell wall biosynthesis
VRGVQDGQLWLLESTKALPRRLDRQVDRRLADRTLAASARIGFETPVLWINDPTGAVLLAGTGWPALYDITDDWLAAERPAVEHERLVRDEGFLLEHCSEVVVCSPRLAATKEAAGPVTLVQNAVDLEAYAVPRARPRDLPEGRLAVYVGTVHTDRLDITLCEETARAIEGHGRLVLVGPDLLNTHDRRRLRDANVLLTGARRFYDVPAYLRHAHVLVVPHLVNAFTDSLDPIKVYEYRAAGRPVVSAPVAGFREHPGSRVTIAPAPEFPEAVRRAMAAPSSQVVATDGVPTWTERAEQMRAVLVRLTPSPD